MPVSSAIFRVAIPSISYSTSTSGRLRANGRWPGPDPSPGRPAVVRGAGGVQIVGGRDALLPARRFATIGVDHIHGPGGAATNQRRLSPRKSRALPRPHKDVLYQLPPAPHPPRDAGTPRRMRPASLAVQPLERRLVTCLGSLDDVGEGMGSGIGCRWGSHGLDRDGRRGERRKEKGERDTGLLLSHPVPASSSRFARRGRRRATPRPDHLGHGPAAHTLAKRLAGRLVTMRQRRDAPRTRSATSARRPWRRLERPAWGNCGRSRETACGAGMPLAIDVIPVGQVQRHSRFVTSGVRPAKR